MSFVAPILFVIITWWVGTGVVLYLQQRISRVRTGLIVTLAMVSVASLFALLHGSSGTEAWQSYLGFMAAISLWGCIELTYYTGLIGGVHKRSCPDNCNTGKRFRLALGASIWHEVSVLFAGALVLTLLYDASNTAGLYSFMVLWLMRWSAKLNLFFGMPNFNTDWFPKRLAYAHSYIRRSPVTWFFPLSMLIASFVAANLLSAALAHPPEHSLMMILPGMLILLAILEHVFMALPIADSKMWNKIFTRDDADAQPADDDNAPLLTQAGSQRIHARTLERVNEVVTLSTSKKAAVALNSVDVNA
ncbi:putative photosynthetic complex assembly protein PuhE, partial [Granulosicoccus sp.]|nr:putative photosynthetic complex assembly protein PuhE [Granulosicoccus sp.]